MSLPPDEDDPGARRAQAFAMNFARESLRPSALHIGGPAVIPAGDDEDSDPEPLPEEYYRQRMGRPVEPRSPETEERDLSPFFKPPPVPPAPAPEPPAHPPQPPAQGLTIAGTQASFRGQSVELNAEEHAAVARIVLEAAMKRVAAQLKEITTPAAPAEPVKRKRGRPRKIRPNE